MATVLNGDYTLKQVLQFTQMFVPNRYVYRRRDVVKRIKIKEIREFDPDRKKAPIIRYVIESKSWPQYYPYLTRKDPRGRTRKYQRTTAHHYDIVLELAELSINTPAWTGRVGSGKLWRKRPPQSAVKTIYPVNRRRWSKARIEAHRKRAKYLDVGDWNSQVQGLNGDFIFRCSYAWWTHGHLFGRNYFGNVPARKTNPQNVVFAPKHFINVIEVLMNRGILEN